MKKSFLPRKDAQIAFWLQNLSAKIATYAAKYNLTAAEVAQLQQAAAFFVYWFTALDQAKDDIQKLTAYKNEVRDGVKAGGSPSVTPVGITFTPPSAVPPGVIPFVLSIVGRIKKHQSYTIADGEDLGIEGPENTDDLNNIKPIFKIELLSGHPNLIWKKGIADGVKIKVLRNVTPSTPGPGVPTPPPASFQFLAIDTYPDYMDTYALPAYGQSSTWVYIMIYMIGDEEVGQWSDPVTVTVTGTP